MSLLMMELMFATALFVIFIFIIGITLALECYEK